MGRIEFTLDLLCSRFARHIVFSHLLHIVLNDIVANLILKLVVVVDIAVVLTDDYVESFNIHIA